MGKYNFLNPKGEPHRKCMYCGKVIRRSNMRRDYHDSCYKKEMNKLGKRRK